ncbi:ABC transporter substrate-binding protein [Bradyrhizobium sp. LMTR 3]|uniref:ABC transporter substrate-binding protein n=1 Tax=Bradyrhizobium sp. LMTR 3 TaxID=189873 RepID=UPI0008105C8E|nr:ABC transporter substrate-binding protein [Bradyrhizobium sp. LMTR 3]OCK53593.1 ABC transporter substrate-binding protein [Bradyrhizobium sp. LMTR 3]
MPPGRRARWPLRLCLAALALVIAAIPASAADTLRVGFQSTGTFAWVLDVIRRHGLAEGAGLDIRVSEFASPDAGKLALNGGSVDIAISDWLWVARERALGSKLLFYPYSSAVGAVMVRRDSPVKELADLKGRVLSVAGGPLDKSWLLVRAAALRRGIDLKREATLQYGAPPLMYQKLQHGEADAGLNFWNFCARLEAAGFRRLLDVRDAESELGIAEPVAMIGYVFTEAFAAGHRGLIDRFLKAARAASDIMERSDAEWDALRPMIRAEDEATFAVMRDRTRAGFPRRSIEKEIGDARKLFRTLAELGGSELVGPAKELDPGLYYDPSANRDQQGIEVR